ncbi:hypothetical protein HDU96_003779 [Phlyctochytrium bullatum]|nr:hypothetical protein HDU96_003779 [Phlyctochytrium bullatum]
MFACPSRSCRVVPGRTLTSLPPTLPCRCLSPSTDRPSRSLTTTPLPTVRSASSTPLRGRTSPLLTPLTVRSISSTRLASSPTSRRPAAAASPLATSPAQTAGSVKLEDAGSGAAPPPAGAGSAGDGLGGLGGGASSGDNGGASSPPAPSSPRLAPTTTAAAAPLFAALPTPPPFYPADWSQQVLAESSFWQRHRPLVAPETHFGNGIAPERFSDLVLERAMERLRIGEEGEKREEKKKVEAVPGVEMHTRKPRLLLDAKDQYWDAYRNFFGTTNPSLPSHESALAALGHPVPPPPVHTQPPTPVSPLSTGTVVSTGPPDRLSTMTQADYDHEAAVALDRFFEHSFSASPATVQIRVENGEMVWDDVDAAPEEVAAAQARWFADQMVALGLTGVQRAVAAGKPKVPGAGARRASADAEGSRRTGLGRRGSAVVRRAATAGRDRELGVEFSAAMADGTVVGGEEGMQAIGIKKIRRKKMNKHKWKKRRRLVRDSVRYNKERRKKSGPMREKQE